MKTVRFIFAISVCFFLSNSTLKAQATLEVSPLNGGDNQNTIQFKIDNLPEQVADTGKFNSFPYYQIFLMYGDGNFERIGSRESPVKNEDTFNYTYRDLENNYPATALMISRKDADKPPGLIITTTSPTNNDNTLVNVSGADNPDAERIHSNSVTNSLPNIPMISEGSEDVVKIGLSHSHSPLIGDDFYFLQENSIHAVPIAYKPTGTGILFFFYSNENELFNYYDEILMKGTDEEQVGTILPNYYQLLGNSLQGFISRMGNIEYLSSNDSYLSNKNIVMTPPNYYDKCLAHEIPYSEASLYSENGVVAPPVGSQIEEGELRLFHFIKTSTFNEPKSDAKFLAVLYDKSPTPDTSKLLELNNLISTSGIVSDSFPLNFAFTPGFASVGNLNFAGFDTLSAKKGEPDDPGGLIIENICKCCDDYIVNFKLTFCNGDDAGKNAVWANIYLKSLLDDSDQALLTDIVELSSCSAIGWPYENLITCNSSSETQVCTETSASIGSPDKKYCYKLEPDGLWKENGEDTTKCGAIRFSARIKASEVYRLKSDTVMRYCVKFFGEDETGGYQSITDVGEFCRPNDILLDSICWRNKRDRSLGEFTCISNSIWENRNQKCESPMYAQHNCQWWCCLSPCVKVGALAFLCLLIGFIIFPFIKKRFKKE